jgi:hypothetical protein
LRRFLAGIRMRAGARCRRERPKHRSSRRCRRFSAIGRSPDLRLEELQATEPPCGYGRD